MGDDLERLSLNTATTKRLTLAEAIAAAQRAGLSSVGLWRDRVAEVGLAEAARMITESGLRVTSLCRGGFLTAADDAGREAALEDNRAAVREAAALGTRELIMVVGGLPEGDRDLVAARARVAERIAELVPYAQEHGVRLVLEPLHPMYAADRAVISTLRQALDLAAPHPADVVGVVVDTFHVWWDPELEEQIARAGRMGRIASYQVCDFNLPIAADALLSRGMMGDGVIDFATIGRWVTAAGYTGPVEVEIFNAEIWAADADAVLATMTQRWRELIMPSLAPVEPTPAGPSRHCLLGRVDPRRLDEYKERHRAVWPELLHALDDAGWERYSLFLGEDGLLVGYVEAADLAEAQRRVAATEVNARWQAAMSGLFAGLDGAAPDASWQLLPEVFNLGEQLEASRSR